MRSDRKEGALPLAAKPLTPGYFRKDESPAKAFIFAQISPPEAKADAARADLKQRTPSR